MARPKTKRLTIKISSAKIKEILEGLKNEGEICIPNLGILQLRKIPAKTFTEKWNKKKMIIKERNRVAFKEDKTLKDYFN
jgi:nucleoid DNA-binding protein